MDAIHARGLRKRFGGTEALRGVDIRVPAGRVLGVLGPNGAGKTTAVRVLTTLVTPDAGQATVAGFDAVTQAPEVRRRIGLTGQYAAVDPLLTGRENLVLTARLYHLGRSAARERADELIERFDLTGAADRPCATYSGGMRRRLDLAASLIARPPVLFLDEPTTGLDPTSRRALWDVIRGHVTNGAAVLLTTQYLEEAEELADQVTVIDQGQVVAEGTVDELKRRVGGERLYVGLADPADLPAALQALAAATGEAPEAVQDGLGVSVTLGGDLLTGAWRASQALVEQRVTAIDFAVRRPSLDEVFHQLTSGGAAPASAQPVLQESAT